MAINRSILDPWLTQEKFTKNNIFFLKVCWWIVEELIELKRKCFPACHKIKPIMSQ